jgi:hypothetical protein
MIRLWSGISNIIKGYYCYCTRLNSKTPIAKALYLKQKNIFHISNCKKALMISKIQKSSKQKKFSRFVQEFKWNTKFCVIIIKTL